MKIRTSTKLFWTILFLFTIIILLWPVFFSIGSSFKLSKEIYERALNIIPKNFTLQNYTDLFTRLPIIQITVNTFIISSTVTLIKLITSFLAAYSFVFFRHKHKQIIYFIFIATIFIPFVVTMIPNYILISKIGWNDSLLGVILPQTADASGILLLNQAMRTIPLSLIEYSKSENLKHKDIMLDVILPLVKPQVISTGIWFFIGSWNSFVWPNLLLKSVDNYTLPLALQMFMSAEAGTNIGVSMAVAVITMIIPVSLYAIFQRQIIGTFTTSGIK